MATMQTQDAAETAAQQLAAVVIAALRPDTADTDHGPDPRMIGVAVRRLGDELGALLRGFESARPRPAAEATEATDEAPDGADETAEATDADSAVSRAARLATHIMLSGHPHTAGST